MKDILDSDLYKDLDGDSIHHLRSNFNDTEELLWAGKPNYIFSLTSLEVGGYDVALGPTNLYFVALAINWISSYTAFTNENYLSSLVYFILGLSLFLLPDIISEIRRRNTFYAITNQYVYFRLWGIRSSKRRIERIKLDDIGDARYEEYKDKSGILYFMLKTPPKFKTYDFSAGGMRHQPTFENVDEVISLQKKILQIVKDAR